MKNIKVFIWKFVSDLYPMFLKKAYGMDIGRNVRISYKARFDKNVNPKGIHIGDNTWILACATIFAHDYCRGVGKKPKNMDVFIGRDCVIGINSIIMPGVKVGNECVVGSGSVVTKNVPDNCIVAGNPAKIIKSEIRVSNGQIIKQWK